MKNTENVLVYIKEKEKTTQKKDMVRLFHGIQKAFKKET
jgi:hypothetical protein